MLTGVRIKVVLNSEYLYVCWTYTQCKNNVNMHCIAKQSLSASVVLLALLVLLANTHPQ